MTRSTHLEATPRYAGSTESAETIAEGFRILREIVRRGGPTTGAGLIAGSTPASASNILACLARIR